jgi:hypothetical protein
MERPMDDNDYSLEQESDALTESRELEAVNRIIEVLRTLSVDSKNKVLRTAMTFLGLGTVDLRPSVRSEQLPASTRNSDPSPFSEDRSLSPKEFMLQKKPMSDVERVATLAYYLTHYRNLPTFKTLDLSKLNTEAAQIKFSNAAFSVNNATKMGFLIPAAHGAKQLSAGGELFVQSLPDRKAAKLVMSDFRKRPRGKKRSGSARQNEHDTNGSDE